MALKIGLDCKLYYDTDGVDGTTWTEATNIKDVTLALSKDTADVSVRGGNGFKLTKATLKDASIDFNIVWDTEDAFFTALQGAFFNDTVIGVMALDASKTTTGAEGLKADFDVINFTRNESLTDAVTVDVSIKPAYNIDTPPSWYTVSGS